MLPDQVYICQISEKTDSHRLVFLKEPEPDKYYKVTKVGVTEATYNKMKKHLAKSKNNRVIASSVKSCKNEYYYH